MLVLLLSVATAMSADPAAGETDQRALAGSGLFQRWDADANGLLHAKEFRAGSPLYSDWDVDGNMQLTEDEFYRGAFYYLDQDDDGILSENEMSVISRWR